MSVFDLHLDSTLGCGFIGITAGVMLYGLSCAQTLHYYRHYSDDVFNLRLLIAFLWLLDTVGTVLDAMCLWHFQIQSRGSPYLALSFPVAFVVEFFVSALIIVIVQIYFIYSIWRFLAYQRWQLPLTITMTLLSFLSFVCGIVTVYKLKVNRNIAAGLQDATATGCLQTLTAVLADIYISVLLCMILNGKKTGFRKTDYQISRLILYSIHRGIVTTAVQLLQFATFVSYIHATPFKLVWTIFHFPGSKLYLNSLLALLNVRHHLRDSGQHAADKLLSGNILDMIPIDHTQRLPRSIEINANCAKPVLGYIVVNREVIESVDV